MLLIGPFWSRGFGSWVKRVLKTSSHRVWLEHLGENKKKRRTVLSCQPPEIGANGTLSLETNIALENPPFWWYLPVKMGIFMGYVSFREGGCFWQTFSHRGPFSGFHPSGTSGCTTIGRLALKNLKESRDFPNNPMTLGWDKSTINPTNFREGSGY